MVEFDKSGAEAAAEPVAVPDPAADAKVVTLRVTTFGVEKFIGFVEGAEIHVSSAGDEVALGAADPLIEQALAVGVIIEKG